IDLILAIAALEPEVEFHIVGGEDADIARWKAQAPANVTFHGYVKPAQLAAHYAAADVCISPHQRKVRGSGGGDITSWMSPMKLFEYMSHGKPIVAANLPAIREVLTDGENALLCEPEDVEAWRRAVARLRGDGALRRALGEAGYAELQRSYTWAGRAEAIAARASEEIARRRGGQR
ncbi:MAG TPA: glycosyltransferase family 4 protein, partial [Allosphingosinicella sp.]